MENNNWDLFAVVRSCSAAASAVADPSGSFSVPPPPPPVLKEAAWGGQKSDLFVFSEFSTVTPPATSRYDQLEMLCKQVYVEKAQQQQQPLLEQQQQQKLQPLLSPKRSYLSPPSNATLFSAVAAGAHQLQTRPRRRPLSQTHRSKRKKNQQKKTMCHVPADCASSDLWAWRKYGQKPIKGSPYPRGYYRCSSSKSCQARKQVERSRADPGMLIITYTAEHNHPVPTHRNSLAGSTRQKCPLPDSSPAQPLPGSPSASDGGNQQLWRPSHPSSSPKSTAVAGLSPTTPLPESAEDKHLRRAARPLGEREEEEEEDDEGEELITVGDVEMMGEEEMVFLGMEVIRGPSAIGATKSLASSVFMAEESGFEEHLFRSPWLFNSDAAAAAGGR